MTIGREPAERQRLVEHSPCVGEPAARLGSGAVARHAADPSPHTAAFVADAVVDGIRRRPATGSATAASGGRIRRAYQSIGQELPEYAEPKFGGPAPVQSLPDSDLETGLDLLYRQASEAAPEFKKKVNALAAATGGKPQYRTLAPARDREAEARSGPQQRKQQMAARASETDAQKAAKQDRDNLDLTKGVGLKGRDRATEKAKSDYGSKATGLADLLGGTVEYDSFPNMVAGFKQCASVGLEIVREKNRLLKPTAAGYRDIMLNVRLSNGHIAELQFNLTGMLAAKAKGHKQYEEARKMEGDHKQSNLPLDAAELAKLKGLYDEMRTIYQEAAVAAGAPVDPAELQKIFG